MKRLMKSAHALAVTGMMLCGWLHAAGRDLPPAAAKAIKASFPDARITGIGRERERGAWYYEVNLRDGKKKFEVEVTEAGVIGEIEGRVGLSDVPDELLQTVRRRVGEGRITRIEKHERRGIARNGEFVPLAKPRISYEIKYYDANGNRREVQLASNQILELPDKAERQIKARFPGNEVTEVEAEDDEGVMIFVVRMRGEKGTIEVNALADGRILEAETPAEIRRVPKGVGNVLASEKLRKSDKMSIFRREMWGTVENGQIVGRKDVTYVARVYRGDAIREYRFDGRGKLTNTPAWEDFDDDDGDDDDDDDDDDDHHEGHRRGRDNDRD